MIEILVRRLIPAYFILLFSFFHSNPVRGQVSSDGTLPTNVNLSEDTFEITGGANSGTNLFHSFEQFSLGTGQTAFFKNVTNLQINNIISRITGGSISNIDGLIKENYGASLILINPNGIIFGPNAQLDIGGSFLGSTANSIVFEDGTIFNAVNPQNTILTVNVPIGLQLGINEASIQTQGSNLKVQPNQTLALIGGSIILQGGNLNAPKGRVELGSVIDNGLVNLNPSNWILGYEGVENFGNIQLNQQALVDVSGERGGAIQIQGQRVSIEDGSQILSNTQGVIDGKDLTINASQLIVESGAMISAVALGEGKGGNIKVKAIESVELIGIGFKNLEDNLILPALSGKIEPPIMLTGLLTGTIGSGNSGSINIETPSLSLKNGAVLNTITFNNGDAGAITIGNSEKVELNASGFFSSSLVNSKGNAGDISIETNKLTISDGAQINSITLSEGSGGNISIDANDYVEILRTPDNILVQTGIFPASLGSGNAGNVTVETSKLIIKDGAGISSSSGGLFGGTVISRTGGNSGNINIKALESVEISGISGLFKDGTRIASFISNQTASENNSQNISIETGKLILKNGGLISDSTLGAGNAGNITINASQIEVIGNTVSPEGTIFPSKIEAASGLAFTIEDTQTTGNAGDININTDKLVVKDLGFLSAESLGTGNGGNINVFASEGIELIGVGFEVFNTAVIAFVTGQFSASGGLALNNAFTGIVTGTDQSGTAGQISIETPSLKLEEGAILSSTTFAEGTGGDIVVRNSETIEVSGSTILTASTRNSTGTAGNIFFDTGNLITKNGAIVNSITYGEGDAGDIIINAFDSVNLKRTPDGVASQSGIFSNSFGSPNTTNFGDAGDIIINTSKLTIQEGAGLSTGSGGITGGTILLEIGGKAGNLNINASESIEISGISGVLGQPFASNTRIASFLSSQTTTDNPSGDIVIKTGKLLLQDGGLITNATLGTGNAGQITIDASQIEVIGSLSTNEGLFTSKIEASSGIAFGIEDNTVKGNSGNLTVTTDNLLLSNGGEINVSSIGSGTGGNLTVQADSILLNDRASIISETTVGEFGNINLQASDIRLRRNSNISTNAILTATGGNISIDTDTLVLLENSNITANAIEGSGGNIQISLSGIFICDECGITASSIFGVDGLVDINFNDVEANQGLVDLPENLINPEEQVALSCAKDREEANNEFINIGRGGLPPSFSEPLSSDPTWRAKPNPTEVNKTIDSQVISVLTSAGLPPPAQGYYINEEGDLVLTSKVSAVNSNNSWSNQAQCH